MKLEIKIPTDLKEIPLSKYQQFLKIASNNTDEIFLKQKMINLFCNVELKEVSNMKFIDVNDISNSLDLLFKQDYKFINRFKLNGIEFGFIPNLDDISLAEYRDLDTYIGDWDNIHKAMAVLYRPIIKKGYSSTYSIEDYEGSAKYSDLMRECPLEYVLGSMVFFYNLGNELLLSTLNYLENNKAIQNILNKDNSEQNGAGIVQSMLLLKETLESLKISCE